MRNHNHNPITAPPVALATLALALTTLLAFLALTATPAHAIGDANQASCPHAEESPGYRTYLPDCRAYELASPPYGGGQPAYGPGKHSPAMTANGEHVIAESYGGFCGTEDLEQLFAQFGTYYEFSRTPTGWGCEALSPPASEFPRSALRLPSADLSKSLWEVLVPGSSGEEVPIVEQPFSGFSLAVREATDDGKGRFTVLGPEVAPGNEPMAKTESNAQDYVAGASADLSHVLESVEAVDKQLWLGDTTVEGAWSLYEYGPGGSGEPVLVGVRNSGRLHGAPSVNDGAELVSQCGTAYNAISASGSVVYFTAQHVEGCPGSQPAVNELYARVNASETVDISEPTTGPAGDCESCKGESEPKAAVFDGASEDGSEVFFTSRQALLPGAKGESLYEYDFAAANPHERLTLIAPEARVTTLSKDGSRLYFQSEAELTATANGNGNGETAKQVSGEKLYVYDTLTGDTAFAAGGEVGISAATSDGQYLAFQDSRRLAGTNDTSEVSQLFEYDAETGTVVRVSAGQRSPGGYECPSTKTIEEGYDCDGNTTSTADAPKLAEGSSSSPASGTSGLSVSETGVVVFTSALPLTPQALQGLPFAVEGAIQGYTQDVYEYREGEVFLISPADEPNPIAPGEGANSRLLGIDESGRDVFFTTTDSLVPQDTDTQSSWYDAREEGGFPAPVPVSGCAGEVCQGPAPPPPIRTAPGSNTVTGSGNLPAPVAPAPAAKPAVKHGPAKCRKGYVKRKHKCVRNKKAKKANQASDNRRSK